MILLISRMEKLHLERRKMCVFFWGTSTYPEASNLLHKEHNSVYLCGVIFTRHRHYNITTNKMQRPLLNELEQLAVVRHKNILLCQFLFHCSRNIVTSKSRNSFIIWAWNLEGLFIFSKNINFLAAIRTTGD